MVWVKSEYAGELAVVSAWLSALLPWYTSYVPEIDGLPGSVLYLRFSVAQVRFVFGLPIADAVDVRTVPGILFPRADGLQSGAVEIAYWVWYVGAAIVGIAVLFSFAMYVDYERLAERLLVHPVRVMGALLTGAGLLLAASTVLFYHHRVFDEYPVPIGIVIMLVLGVSLLRVELLDDEERATDGENRIENDAT